MLVSRRRCCGTSSTDARPSTSALLLSGSPRRARSRSPPNRPCRRRWPVSSVAPTSRSTAPLQLTPTSAGFERASFVLLPDSSFTRNRINQLLRVVADALLEHGLDLTDVANRRRRIAVDDDQVCLLAGGEAAHPLVAAEILGAVQRRDRNRFERRETGVDEQLDLPLIGKARNHTAAAGRVRAGDQQAARLRERALERHAFREQGQVDRLLVLRRPRVVLFELLAQLRRQHFKARRFRPS